MIINNLEFLATAAMPKTHCYVMKPNSTQLNSMQPNKTLLHKKKTSHQLRIINIWGVLFLCIDFAFGSSCIHGCLFIVLKTVLFMNIARPWKMLHEKGVNSASSSPTIGPIAMTMWAIDGQGSMEKGPIHPMRYTPLHSKSISIFCHMLLSEST